MTRSADAPEPIGGGRGEEPGGGGPVTIWRASWLRTSWDRRRGTLIAALAALAVALAVTTALLSPWVAAVLLTATLRSLHELLLPVTFRLDDAAVSVTSALARRRHEWGEFTDAKATDVGVMLCSPVRRSLHLLDAAPKAEVVATSLARIALARRDSAESGSSSEPVRLE